MIINDIPLENLKAILASGTPLALETTEALVERLEVVGRRLDAMRRQRDGYMNDARRKQKALDRVSTLFEGVTGFDHGDGVTEDLNATIKATINRVLDGEPNE